LDLGKCCPAKHLESTRSEPVRRLTPPGYLRVKGTEVFMVVPESLKVTSKSTVIRPALKVILEPMARLLNPAFVLMAPLWRQP